MSQGENGVFRFCLFYLTCVSALFRFNVSPHLPFYAFMYLRLLASKLFHYLPHEGRQVRGLA
jgi:hypothetical protein